MSKDELILDILEKTYGQVQEVRKEVSVIRTQQAVHDEVVKQHEARSTNLETRMAWVENKFIEIENKKAMVNGAVKLVLFLVGAAAFLANLQKILSLIHL